MPPEKKLKKAPFGCLFWIAFILLIFVLFFANKDKITRSVRSLQESGFFSKADSTPAQPSITPQARAEGGSLVQIVPASEGDSGTASAQAGSSSSLENGTAAVAASLEDLRELVPPPQAESLDESEAGHSAEGFYTESPPASAESAHVPMRQQRLFFVSIDNEGRVLRQEVLKDIPRSDSPLADALNALFAGPSDAEARLGLISLIPQGTRLLSASVRDGVATVNVTEEFRFNGFGVEGAIGQLAQVVFTATTFPTVNSVQILIEGQRLEYLGAEGVWIGTPLARKDFSN